MLAGAGAGAGEQRVGAGTQTQVERLLESEEEREEWSWLVWGEAAGQPVHISARLFPIFRPKGTLSSRGAL